MGGTTGRLDPAVADVRRAVRLGCADLDAGQHVLVGCSGGADSMALAAATVFEGSRAGWLVGVIVVDHGLQAASARTADVVADRARRLGCADVEVVRASVDAAASIGPEAAAREARYRVFEVAAAPTEAVVLLGHTRDDQAETVLLGLARGSGLRSIAGMSTIRGRYRRPLLGLPRATTSAACAALGLEVWSDPHNADGRFARVRVRRDALPALEAALGPGVASALARTADLARLDADALDEISVAAYDRMRGHDGSLDVSALAAEPTAIRRRVLRQAALDAGAPAADLTAQHVEEIDRLMTGWHGQNHISLPGPVIARRVSGRIGFSSGVPGHPGGFEGGVKG